MHPDFDALACDLAARLPDGQEVIVIGSTDFHHPESEGTCQLIGRLLAGIPDLQLITGGVEGVGETLGRAFFAARLESGLPPLVYHVLPHGEPAWDYGTTLFASQDMSQRREVLARLGLRFLAVEGGSGHRPRGPRGPLPSGDGCAGGSFRRSRRGT